MTDEDIYAFGPAAPPGGAASFPPGGAAPRAPGGGLPHRGPRRWWPWLLAGALVLGLLATATLGSALLSLADSALHGLHLQIDGSDWSAGPIDGDGLAWKLQDHWGPILLGVTGALAVIFVLVTVLVPLVVGLGLLAVVLGVGAALLAVAAVVAAALSPLWLLGLLLWLMFRRRPRPA